VICKKRSNGAITLRTRRCSASETKVTNITALTGATGPTGAPGSAGSEGADGSLRIYGDGSSGALNVATTTSWSGSEALGQYTDCSIAAGVTLTVPTGTVLRCSGSFTNDGTISSHQLLSWPTDRGRSRIRRYASELSGSLNAWPWMGARGSG
jgi:hypothetical protein